MRAQALLLGIGWPILAAVGCGGDEGPQRVPLSGSVTLADIPDNLQGTVSLMPEGDTKGPAANGIIMDGQYRFTSQDGPVAGSHRVLVDVEPPRGKFDAAKQNVQQQWKFEFHITIPSEPPYEFNFPLLRDRTGD